MNPAINKISDNLYLITLVPPIPGFNDFIGIWLHRGHPSFIVDVGPSSTADTLLQALLETQTTHLDFILLTHIHLDHAGAIGEIAERFPDTPIVCHPKGIPHMVNPERLWEGTRKTLGATALAYGPIRAVSEERFITADPFKSEGIEAVMTPGHAVHHVSFLSGNYLFLGETAGVCLSLPNRHQYHRPATPPRLYLDTAIKSIETLIAKSPSVACFSHFGLQVDAVEKLDQHRRQLLLWEEILETRLKDAGTDEFIQICLNSLLQEDPLLEGFSNLPPDIQERETFFLANSIKGFLGYLDSK